MPSQVEHGNAFEYAVSYLLETGLKWIFPEIQAAAASVMTIKDDRYDLVYKSFLQLPQQLQVEMINAAKAGLRGVLPFEPNLWNGSNQDPLLVKINPNLGESGDVRDVLVFRGNETKPDWVIGFSCKWNHDALKHSRLSEHIDFGKEWVGIHCSPDYWTEIQPIMDLINTYIGQNWEDFPNKQRDIYIPLLKAFINEIHRLNSRAPNLPALLAEYFLGKTDFYKIIGYSRGRVTQVQAYNLHGTLNCKYKNQVPRIKIQEYSGRLPTKIADIYIKQNRDNTIVIIMDEGWQFDLRIHNADRKVMKSLKFDIRFTGNPIATYAELWTSEDR